MTPTKLTDQEALNDAVASQKQISSSYNTYAGECVMPQLRDELLCILDEEHDIQADFFNEMQTRGWYQVKPAEQQMITETKQKFQMGV